MKYLILLLSLFLFPSCEAQQVKVGVVDTGIDIQDPRFKSILCKSGHMDFTHTSLNDTEGHGTAIVSLIAQQAGNSNYCLIIYKYYDPKMSGYLNSIRESSAFNMAIEAGVKIINVSAGGPEPTEYEFAAMNRAYEKDIYVVAAAGNHGEDLAAHPFYPASYDLDNVLAVGNILDNGLINYTSNYGGRIRYYEKGTNVKVACLNPLSKVECFMSGTSMSAALHTGKLIKHLQ